MLSRFYKTTTIWKSLNPSRDKHDIITLNLVQSPTCHDLSILTKSHSKFHPKYPVWIPDYIQHLPFPSGKLSREQFAPISAASFDYSSIINWSFTLWFTFETREKFFKRWKAVDSLKRQKYVTETIQKFTNQKYSLMIKSKRCTRIVDQCASFKFHEKTALALLNFFSCNS